MVRKIQKKIIIGGILAVLMAGIFSQKTEVVMASEKESEMMVSASAEVSSIIPAEAEVGYANPSVAFSITGTELDSESLEAFVSPLNGVTIGQFVGNEQEQKVHITFPSNYSLTPVTYKIYITTKTETNEIEANVTVKAVNTISGTDALKSPTNILDVRELNTRNMAGHIAGSMFCPQFPLYDSSLDIVMQEYAQRFVNGTEPIYILCKSGLMGAPRATKNMLVAGIEPERIFTIIGGAKDSVIAAALTRDRTKDFQTWQYIDAQNAVSAANNANSKVHILDVRPLSQYNEEHLRRSESVPIVDNEGEIQPELLNNLAVYVKENYMNDTEPIYVLCDSGDTLSKTALSLMRDIGIDSKRMFIIQGGTGNSIIAGNFGTIDQPSVPGEKQEELEKIETDNKTISKVSGGKIRVEIPHTGDADSVIRYVMCLGITGIIFMIFMKRKQNGKRRV